MIASTEPVVIMTRAELDALIQRTIDAATDRIAAQLGNCAPALPSAELWDARQAGSYLHVSAYTVAHDWAHQRDFPPAIVLGNGPRAKRRWKADEIRQWAERHQQRKAA